ncbi:hypothetical protein, partial [Enterococcus faecium]
KAKVRITPVILAGVAAAALSPLWPLRQTWVQAVIPAIAVASQLVSPWSRQAATYASYVRSASAKAKKAARAA